MMNTTRKNIRKKVTFKSNKFMEACFECVINCEACATTSNECANICRDCADICNLCLRFEARDSAYKGRVHALCSEICNTCANVCSKYDTAHCQACAKSCRKCATICENM